MVKQIFSTMRGRFKRRAPVVCKDCGYHRELFCGDDPPEHLCNRKPVYNTNLVTGKTIQLRRACEIERLDIFGFCGEKGKYFIAKG